MKTRRLLALPLSGVAALSLACGGEEILSSETLTPEEVTLEILDNVIEAGFPEDDILVTDEGEVYVGRDALVTLEASREMIAPPTEEQAGFLGEGTLEQYRTRNLVNRNRRTICIDGRRFSGKLSTALNWSINNYNNLGFRFTMRRITTSLSGCNALIVARTVGGTGGSAGFPSRGFPFGTINIGTGNSQFDTNVVEHIITHELGHCLGMRHSDYFNRSISCGQGGNEGSGGVGAIYIPGTPRGATVGGSLMNSCFRSTENGEFTSSDRVAFRAVYPR